MTAKLTSTGVTFGDGTTQATTAEMPSGTLMLFAQSTAPTGWTKSTTHNNKALRVVSGTASSGGNAAFTTAFASYTPSGNVSVAGSVSVSGSIGSTTLSINQIPSHSHSISGSFPNGDWGNSGRASTNFGGGSSFSTGNAGGGGSHNHSHNLSGSLNINSSSFSGTAKDLAVQYVDVIIASKN
jgi:microcystin-dependent protein